MLADTGSVALNECSAPSLGKLSAHTESGVRPRRAMKCLRCQHDPLQRTGSAGR